MYIQYVQCTVHMCALLLLSVSVSLCGKQGKACTPMEERVLKEEAFYSLQAVCAVGRRSHHWNNHSGASK